MIILTIAIAVFSFMFGFVAGLIGALALFDDIEDKDTWQ